MFPRVYGIPYCIMQDIGGKNIKKTLENARFKRRIILKRVVSGMIRAWTAQQVQDTLADSGKQNKHNGGSLLRNNFFE